MKLIIPSDVEARLNAYVQAVDGEIAGMGKIKVRDDGNLEVVDIAIYTQTVTAATADLSSEALAKFQVDLIRRGESMKDWYLWWHSHDTMAAFFSSTDVGTIDGSTEFSHLCSLVVNKKRERKCRFDYHHPARMYLENIPVEVEYVEDERTSKLKEDLEQIYGELEEIRNAPPSDIEDILKEVDEKVTVKKPIGYNKHNSGNYPNYKQTQAPRPYQPIKGGHGHNGYDASAYELLIKQTEDEMTRLENAGQYGSVEYDELQADLHAYEAALEAIYDLQYSAQDAMQ